MSKTQAEIIREIASIESSLLNRERQKRFALIDTLKQEIEILSRYLEEDDAKVSELLKLLSKEMK